MTEPSSFPTKQSPDAELLQRWQQGQCVDVDEFLAGFTDLDPTQVVAVLLVDQSERWKAGQHIPAENYLRRFPALEADAEAVVELTYGEFLLREEHGERPCLEEFLWRFPNHEARLRQQVELHLALAFPGEMSVGSQITLVHTTADVVGMPAVPGYEILEVLGRGGMGVVYKARQVKANRPVALKMILHGGHASQTDLQRFRTEVVAIARLQHPNIVTIYEVDDHHGTPFFSMELCAGGSLDRKLAGTPLEPRKAAALVRTLAQAMHCAHQANVIHRDLKPANVLLSFSRDAESSQRSAPDGTNGTERTDRSSPSYPSHERIDAGALRSEDSASRLNGVVPKITDFGLARRLDEAGQTSTGAVMGTPSYMAPEQASGMTKEVGPAADVYSLGAILYECLTGRPPFRAATPFDTMMQVISDEPVRPRQLNARTPIDLETICLKCLHKAPAGRYESAQALSDDLQRFLDDQPIHARRTSGLGRAWRWCRRNPAVTALTAAVVLALLAGTTAATFFAIRANDNATQARANEDQANENARTARENEEKALQEKAQADAARALANKSREEADATRERLQDNLYFAEMNMAGQAAESAGSLGQVRELLEHWRPKGSEPDRRGWEWYYLRGLGPRPLLTLKKHSAPVNAVSWSPDGLRLASASNDGTIRLWDSSTGREIATLRGHTAEVWNATWRPDGKCLASSGNDYTLRVWDEESRQQISIHRVGTAWWGKVSWSPDGRRLACPSADKKVVRIFDADSGQEIGVLRGHEEPGRVAIWSPNGRRLASAGGDKVIRIWDMNTRKETARIEGTGTVAAISWSPDGRRLVVAAEAVKVWDVDAKKEVAQFSGHTGAVYAVSWSPSGLQVASAGVDQTVKLWDPNNGREITALRHHTNHVNGVSWSPDGRRLASASADGTIKVWDLFAGRNSAGLASGNGHPSSSLSWSPDGRRLASASGDTKIRLWNTETLRDPVLLPGHTEEVLAVNWSPDGRYLASASVDKSVRLWNAVDGKEIAVLKGHLSPVIDVAWSPDGRRLASAGLGDPDRSIRLWDVSTRREFAAPVRHDLWAQALRWRPDGRRIALAAADGTIRLWDTNTWKQLSPLRGHTDQVKSVNWSRDGKRLASGSLDGTIRLWDPEKYQEIRTLRGHAAGVNGVSWNPDGRRLASVGVDRVLKLWDIETGREIITFHGHEKEISAVSWSRDGMRLASTSHDQAIRLWDAAVGYREERSPLLLPELERRLKADPRNSADLLLRAEIHARQGHWDRAAEDWVLAQKLKDGKLLPWFPSGWWAAGPFADASSWEGISDTDPDPLKPLAMPNPGSSNAAPLYWRATTPSSNGCVDLSALFPQAKTGTAFALLRVYSPRDQSIAALLGSTGTLRFWLNGRLHHEVNRAPPPSTDDVRVPLTLRAGWNTLLFQVGLGTGINRLCLWLSAEPADRVVALVGRGRWDEATTLLMDALKQQPDEPPVQLLAGRIFWQHAEHLRRQGQMERADQVEHQARASYEKLLLLRPNQAGYAAYVTKFLHECGGSAALRGDWRKASADFTRMVGFPTVDAHACYDHALVLLQLGDTAGYKKACAAMCERFAPSDDQETVRWLAKACVLTPQAVANYDSIVRRMEKAVADTPAWCGNRHALGALLYRAGKVPASVRRLNEAVELHQKTGIVSDWLFLAMAHQRQGQVELARKWLDKAASEIDRFAKLRAKTADQAFNLTELQLLRREAEARAKP